MSKLTPLQATAPRRIFLQIGDEPEHHSEPFPENCNDGDITWCATSATACEVAYVREDLAAAPAGGAEPVAWMYTLWFGDEAVRQVAFCYRFDLAVASPFGREGIDFAAGGKVEEQPLYAAPTAQLQPAGLSPLQESKYTVNGHAIVNRASGEEIPADEPVFIFRARDKWAAGVLGDYATFVEDPAHKAAVEERFIQFGEWAEAHPERMKEPDTQPSQPTLLNGLTEQETAASASVAGLSGAQPEAPAEPSAIAVRICNAVAELGDRNSPEDWPEAMLVTHAELHAIVLDALATTAPASQQPAELTDERLDSIWFTYNDATQVDHRAYGRALIKAIKAQGGSQ